MSGKSFTGGLFTVDSTFEPGARIIYARYTMVAASISVIDELKEKVDILGYSEIFQYKGNKAINTQTGNDVIFKGLKASSKAQTAALKSIKDPTVLVIEEAEEIPTKEEFNKIRRSFRKKNAKIKIVLIYNPPEEDHWLWDEFFKPEYTYEEFVDGHPVTMTTDPRVTHIHTTWLDNAHNLSEDVIKYDILFTRENDPEEYAKDFIGTKGTPRTGLEFYDSYRGSTHRRNVKLLFQDFVLHAAFDQNVIPYAYTSLWTIFEDQENIYLYNFDEIANKPPRHYTSDTAEEIEKRYGDKMDSIVIYGDASGNKRGTRSKETDYGIVVKHLYQHYPIDKTWRMNPPIKKRGEFINEIFKGKIKKRNKTVKILIDPRCKIMHVDLSKIKTDENGKKAKEIATLPDGTRYQQYGHATDTLDYIVIKVLEQEFKRYINRKRPGVKIHS